MDRCWFVLRQTDYLPPQESYDNGRFHQSGAICLGHFIEDLKHLDQVINRGGPEAFPLDMPVHHSPPVEFTWESEKDQGIELSAAAEAPVGAAVGITAMADLQFALKQTTGRYSQIEKLDTTFVQPTRDYLNRCLATESIKEYLADHRFLSISTWSMYMVTGLKIARGRSTNTTSVKQERSLSGGPGAGATGVAEARLRGGISSTDSMDTSTKSSGDFVWAVKLLKITKGVFDSKWTQETYTKGATFDMSVHKPSLESILIEDGLAECATMSIGDEAIVIPSACTSE